MLLQRPQAISLPHADGITQDLLLIKNGRRKRSGIIWWPGQRIAKKKLKFF